LLKIIHEDNNSIVVYKPAGLATQTASMGQKDLVSEVKNHLASQNKRPYAALINRLDQPVKGLVLMAKNEKAASEFSKMLSEGKIGKYYRAVVYGHMKEAEGRLEDFLIKDGRSNTSRVSDRSDPAAKKAILEYKVIGSDEATQTLDIHLITGRHHQIRVQLSNAGCPILGDVKYGTEGSKAYGREQNISETELTAYKLILDSPGKKICLCLDM